MSELGRKLSKSIETLRGGLGLTQQRLAELVGVDRATILRWEKDRGGVVSLEELERLAKALSTDPFQLITGVKFDPAEEKRGGLELARELGRLVDRLSREIGRISSSALAPGATPLQAEVIALVLSLRNEAGLRTVADVVKAALAQSELAEARKESLSQDPAAK